MTCPVVSFSTICQSAKPPVSSLHSRGSGSKNAMCPSISRYHLLFTTTTRRLNPLKPRFVVPSHFLGHRTPRSHCPVAQTSKAVTPPPHESDLLECFDHPVDATAMTVAIFAGSEEERIGKGEVPDGENEDEKGVETAAETEGGGIASARRTPG